MDPVLAGQASNDLGGEKTASASESLALNLAANATNGEKTVHEKHHGTAHRLGQELALNGLRKANLHGEFVANGHG